ncbi:MAG: 50S ribosomal protein L18 [Planctomycetota bacterium]
MPNPEKKRARHRHRKALRIRKRLRGTTERPRLSVARSLKNISCQVVNDETGRTLAAASSLDKALRDSLKGMNQTDMAKKVGAEIAARATKAGVSKVSFDRGARQYHGRVKALAEAARAGGLEF